MKVPELARQKALTCSFAQGPARHAYTVVESLLDVSWWQRSVVSCAADGFAELCAPLWIWVGAAMTIITTAIPSISKPMAPVSETAAVRSGLTKAAIFVTPLPHALQIRAIPLTYNASLESERYEIVTAGALRCSFLSVG